MKIDSIIGLSASNQLKRTSQMIANSLHRLASGQRVSSPQDDPAAYSLGVNLEAQIRGLGQSNLNINQSKGLLETADTALSSQMDLIQRMRELAIRASSTILSVSERNDLQTALQSLLDEFSRITDETEFNDIHLLDGSFDLKKLQIGPDTGDTMDLQLGNLQASKIFQKTVGTGSYQTSVTFQATSSTGVRWADVNNDGHLDAINTSSAGYFRVELGDGQGHFEIRKTFTTAANQIIQGVVDFNNDGNLDVITATNIGASPATMVFLGYGDGNFATPLTFDPDGPGSAPEAMNFADFNKDGDLDIIVSDSYAPEMLLLLGNGDGTFERVDPGIYSNNQQILTGDFNNDGNVDFVVQNNNTIDSYLGNGDGTFASVVTTQDFLLAVGASWAVGDMNGDGKLDIIEVAFATNDVFFEMGNGDGTFNPSVTIVTSINANNAEKPFVADLNGDGLLDVAYVSSTATIVDVLINKGNMTFTEQQVTARGNGAIALVDINSDGVPDIARKQGYTLQNTAQQTALSDFNLTSSSKAQNLLSILDSTFTKLELERGNIAAVHSRLDQAASGNLLISDSFTAARSKAIDVDFASEVADLVKNQILQQAQVAVLGQANVNAQIVLQLLRN